MCAYDMVSIVCPKCNKPSKHNEQSKAYKCQMVTYDHLDIPESIAEDLNNTYWACQHDDCNYSGTLRHRTVHQLQLDSRCEISHIQILEAVRDHNYTVLSHVAQNKIIDMMTNREIIVTENGLELGPTGIKILCDECTPTSEIEINGKIYGC